MSPSSRERAYAKRRYEKWQARLGQRAVARARRRLVVRVGLVVVVVAVVVVGAVWWVVS